MQSTGALGGLAGMMLNTQGSLITPLEFLAQQTSCPKLWSESSECFTVLDVPFTVNLSLGTLNESLLLLKDQVKLLGLGNESTLHNTVKFDPILAPIEVLLLSMHFGASENIRVRILKLVVV